MAGKVLVTRLVNVLCPNCKRKVRSNWETKEIPNIPKAVDKASQPVYVNDTTECMQCANRRAFKSGQDVPQLRAQTDSVEDEAERLRRIYLRQQQQPPQYKAGEWDDVW